MPRALILDAVLYAALFELVTVPFFGWLSDRWGRRTLYIGGAILSAALAFPLFSLIDSKDERPRRAGRGALLGEPARRTQRSPRRSFHSAHCES